MDSRIDQTRYSISKQFLVALLMMAVAAGLSYTNEAEASIRSDARERLEKHAAHTDHSSFFHKPFADGPSVTRACLKCHQDSAQQVMKTH